MRNNGVISRQTVLRDGATDKEILTERKLEKATAKPLSYCALLNE